MPGWLAIVILSVATYLLGGVPFAQVIARLHGHDLRKVGSGNLGATNAGRVLGFKWFLVIFLLDAGKGFLPTFFAVDLLQWMVPEAGPELIRWIGPGVGIAAMLGHIVPVWMGFKGGKGVATGAGVFLALSPIAVATGFVFFLAALILFRRVSLGSILGAIGLVLSVTGVTGLQTGVAGEPESVMIYVMAALVIVRHWKNIQRLLQGTEPKTSFSKKP